MHYANVARYDMGLSGTVTGSNGIKQMSHIWVNWFVNVNKLFQKPVIYISSSS